MILTNRSLVKQKVFFKYYLKIIAQSHLAGPLFLLFITDKFELIGSNINISLRGKLSHLYFCSPPCKYTFKNNRFSITYSNFTIQCKN